MRAVLPRLVLALVAAVVFFLSSATYTFDAQLVSPTGDVPHLIRRFVMYMGMALGLVWVLELLFRTVAATISRRLELWSSTASAHPWITVTVAALVGTLIACYPTLAGGDFAPGSYGTNAGHRFIWSLGVGAAALIAVGPLAPASIAAASSAFLSLYAFRFNHPATFVLTFAPWVLAAWFLLAKASDRRDGIRAGLLLAIASALVLFVSPPAEALAMLVVLWSIGLLAIAFADRGRRLGGYRFIGAAVAALSMVPLIALRWAVFPDALGLSVSVSDVASIRFADRADTLAMMLGSLAPLPLALGLQTLTVALALAALLSSKRLLAHRSILACVLGAAGAIAVAYGAVPADVLARVPLIATIQTVDLTLLTVAIVPIVIVSALGARVVLEATRTTLIVITAGIAVCAAWVFSALGGWSGTSRIDVWLALFALGGAVAVPASFRATARSFPRLLPLIAAVALAGLLVLLGLRPFLVTT